MKRGYQSPAGELSGFRTFVQNPDGTVPRSQPGQVGPKPRSRSFPQPALNGPPASGDAPDGKSLHKDKARTKGQPGEDYGTPSLGPSNAPLKRRTMEADFLRDVTPRAQELDQPQYDRAKPLRLVDTIPAQPLDQGQVMNAPGSAKVIPEGHDFVNRKALRIGDIERLCSPDLRLRSRGVRVRLRRVDAANQRWTFEAQGSGGVYKVKVKVMPSRKNITSPSKADIQVSCSCPFWRWQGPEYHSKSKGYLLGPPTGSASRPDIKDPHQEHGACKHVLACLEAIKGYPLPGRGRTKQGSVLVQRLVSRFYLDCLRRHVR